MGQPRTIFYHFFIWESKLIFRSPAATIVWCSWTYWRNLPLFEDSSWQYIRMWTINHKYRFFSVPSSIWTTHVSIVLLHLLRCSTLSENNPTAKYRNPPILNRAGARTIVSLNHASTNNDVRLPLLWLQHQNELINIYNEAANNNIYDCETWSTILFNIEFVFGIIIGLICLVLRCKKCYNWNCGHCQLNSRTPH